MIKRIIYLMESPFNWFYYKFFGIETLQKNGFKVEIWNFGHFLYPQFHKEVKISDPFNWENYNYFLTLDEARAALSNLKNDCFVVCFISYRIQSFPIYRALSRFNIRYCLVMSNAFPWLNNRIKMDTIIKNLKKITIVKILNALYKCVPYNYLGIKPANLILAGGTESIKYKYSIDKNTEILWLHALDYDSYIEKRDSPVQCDKNMGVFLDEYMPLHPDSVQLGLSVPCTPEEYYPGLCKFFDYMEHVYGVHIVIAAHPKSNYEAHPDYFGGRTVIKGQTAELVRKSRFTIAHSSASINLAVLFHKPVIFITSNRIQQNYIGPQIDLMASWLGKKTINIDNPIMIDLEEEISINEKAYMKYIQSYIKKECSEELPFWQIFANRIKKIS